MKNKKITYLFILLLILGGVFLYRASFSNIPEPLENNQNKEEVTKTKEEENLKNDSSFEVVAENLKIPWDLTFLPSGDMLVTERPGKLLRVTPQGKTSLIKNLSVEHVGEGGLLGIVLHPDFEQNNLLYLYTTTSDNSQGEVLNKVKQYRLKNNKITETSNESFEFNAKLPGAPYHDGGRIKFGPDRKLYITVGDATHEDWAQIYNSKNQQKNFAGSILRINPDGSIPTDNPFDNAVYSYGHRNPQGLSWDEDGRLWSTEHGRSGILSGLDEINLIKKGQNYGWPDSQGDTVKSNTLGPIKHSGPDTTWAPASALWYKGKLFFGGLRGQALYEANLKRKENLERRFVKQKWKVTNIEKHFKNKFGRIRTVHKGPDGMFYLTTSNRDGRGDPNKNDDKIIKVNPEKL